jgi:predicted ester cyclase
MTHKEIAKAWFASIDKKDFDTLSNLMHPDHRFQNPMAPQPASANEHLGIMKMMTGALSGEHVLELPVEEGNHVVVKGRWSGKHTGDFNGIAATGNPVQFSWIDILEIVDGQVRREHLEMNPAAIMMQIGAVAANN